MIIIDGETFNVPIVEFHESCEFLDKFAERTEDGVLHRELIGSYHNYEVVFGANADPAEAARLWLKLTEAVEYHTVTVPDDGGVSYTFTAYFASVGRDLRRVRDAQTFWRELSVHFIARQPRRTP